MPKDLKSKTLRLRRGDIQVRTRGDLTAVVWKDKRDVCLHDPPTEGNYRDERRNAIKLAIVADYNCHVGHVDNVDRMANSYTASRRTWKWTKKLFFHLLDLAIVNSYILLSSCGGKKISHRDFCLTLIREMLARSGHDPQPSIPVGRPTPASANIRRLDTHHKQPQAAVLSRVFSEGCDANRGIQMFKCAMVLIVDRSFLNITTQKTTYKTSFHSFSMETVGASTRM